MSADTANRHPYGKKGLKTLLLLSVTGVALNLLITRLVGFFNLPLYLDMIGTVIVSALGGYLPGIVVGFLTNIIGGIQDPGSLYYCSTSVLIAFAAAYLAQKGCLKHLRGIILTILVLTLIGGGIGSVLTWLLNGKSFGPVASQDLTQNIYRIGTLSPFLSQLTADLLVDLLDKTITVLAACLVLRLIPVNIQNSLYVRGWRQNPLSGKLLNSAEARMYRQHSLRSKIIIFLAVSISVIAVTVTIISYILYHGAIIDQETRMATGLCSVVRDAIVPENVDMYILEGENAPGYKEVEKALTDVLNSSEELQYVYVYRVLEDGCHVVFDIDTPDLPGGEPGEIVPFDESFEALVPELLEGKNIDPIITDDTYGWLLSVYLPVKDKNGVCQCYACVDISMDQLRLKEQVFFARIISLFIGFFVVLLAAGLWLADYSFVFPINAMAITAGTFAFDTETERKESIEKINKLQIETGDEIENLYESLTKMGDDSMEYIEDSRKKAKQLEKMQNGLIYVLADLVESRDKLTGDHIKKTAAYTKIITDQLKENGCYTDILTDEYCENIVSSAPLHDIGKIVVPDAILNKPGKLTDEEFAIMKTHAAAGGEILRQALEAVSVSENDSGYLQEAIRMASYHHEKWNGKGYPEGLAGEDIPLSARIMAVADVFDALVSKRCYKDGFPFEKAMSIIEESSGSHFDPNIAAAFIQASDRVREVAEMYDSRS